MQSNHRSFLIHREADMSRLLPTRLPIGLLNAHQKTSSYTHEEVFIYAVCNGFR